MLISRCLILLIVASLAATEIQITFVDGQVTECELIKEEKESVTVLERIVGSR